MHVGRHDERVVSNVGSFIANHPEMLGAMVLDPRCLVAVVEFEDVRYVQYWVGPDGAVVAEVVSNLNIGEAVALSPDDEERLRRAGWSEPTLGARPNWRYEANDVAGLMRIVAMSRDAVYSVLRECDVNTVTVRVWEGRYAKRPGDAGREPTRIHQQTTLRGLGGSIGED